MLRSVFSEPDPACVKAPALIPLSAPSLTGTCALQRSAVQGEHCETGCLREPDAGALSLTLEGGAGSPPPAWGSGITGHLEKFLLRCTVSFPSRLCFYLFVFFVCLFFGFGFFRQSQSVVQADLQLTV